MGEEIGAAKPFRYTDFAQNKEDLIGDRTGIGKNLCSFYKDLVGYVLVTPAARSESIDVIYIHNDNRVIGFTRTDATARLLVLASLNDAPFSNGYKIQVEPERLPSGGWREVFNSDAAKYGGSNIGNAGAILNATDGMLEAMLPAHGFIVFKLETS
jgi:1,4-alpha-glucan branching enzyme